MSYKTCIHFDKSIGKRGIRKGKLIGKECSYATNRRICRRCPQLPTKKLSEFTEELKVKKVQDKEEN